MPVLVSLYELVRIKGTRPLWPSEFQDFVKAIEDDCKEKTTWGACADWLDETDQNEPLLARGFRMVAKSDVRVRRTPDGSWRPVNLPSELSCIILRDEFDVTTPAGLASELSQLLTVAEEKVRASLAVLEKLR